MDAEYLDPAVFGDRIEFRSFEAAMSRFSHHLAAKDAEIARLNSIIDAERDMQAKLVVEGTRLTAALKAEREQAEAIRAACPAIIRDRDGITLWANTVNHHLLIKRIEDFDARRAAEAKVSDFGSCGITNCRAVTMQPNHGFCLLCRRAAEAKE